MSINKSFVFERQAVQGINEILTIGDGFIISDGVTIDDISVVFEIITDNFLDTASLKVIFRQWGFS